MSSKLLAAPQHQQQDADGASAPPSAAAAAASRIMVDNNDDDCSSSIETIRVSFADPSTARLVQAALQPQQQQQADAAAGGGLVLNSSHKIPDTSTEYDTGDEKVQTAKKAETRTSSLVDEQQEECIVAQKVEESTVPSPINTHQQQEQVKVNHTNEASPVLSTLDDAEGLLNVSVTPPFGMGDHVYKWCNVGPIPAVFQHHAIVIDAWPSDEWYETTSSTSDSNWILLIADFSAQDSTCSFKRTTETSSNAATTSATSSTRNQESDQNQDNNKTKPTRTALGLRFYQSPKKDWHKVTYDATSFWKRHFTRTGTCTAVKSDSPGLVRARVQFLLDHPHVIPAYHVVQSNCECVAVWCKTGTWGTVQATSWLAVTAAGQAKSAMTVAGMAATTQVTVPAAGLWGWFGYTTQVSLVSTQPYLLPAIAAYGILTVGVPTVLLLHSKQQCKERTVALNQAFWEAAVAHPDVFVECITHWSSQYEPLDDVK